MATRRARLAALLALLPIVAAGSATAEEGGQTVSAAHPVRRCLADRVTASGTFASSREAEVRADRDGLIVGEVMVEPGDIVITGQVLAKLVPAAGAPGDPVAVRAPVDGTLLAVGATVGAYVSAREGGPLFRIAEPGSLELKAQVLVAGLASLRPDLPAKLHVVGVGELGGRLLSIEGGIDPQTQLGVLHLVADPNPKLRAGLFARAEIDVGTKCGLVVPLSALLYGREGTLVGLVQEDRVVMRAVGTGLLQGNSIAIRDGLSENDMVIARAGTFLREGDRVRAIPTPAEGSAREPSEPAADDPAPARP